MVGFDRVNQETIVQIEKVGTYSGPSVSLRYMEQKLIANLNLYEALTDAEVVARVVDGDLPLFELIMRRYNRRLFRYTRSILNDDLLAQDAVQETYLNAFRNLRQFRGPDGFASWLMRIASRIAIRIGQRETGISLANSDIDPDELLAQESKQPERLAINSEIVGQVEDAIDNLPRDFRVVFMLREMEGMSIDETANTLGINPGTVKTRLHRARQILRTRFNYRLEELRELAFAFAGARCDYIVKQVFSRLKNS